jgi:hypothetical protein
MSRAYILAFAGPGIAAISVVAGAARSLEMVSLQSV